jgi:cell division protein ZapA
MSTVLERNIVSVRLLGKSYQIKCPPEQAEALQTSAHYIENKLREMKQASGSTDTHQLLVVMALNLCHELTVLKSEKNQSSDTVGQKLQSLQNRIQCFLAEHEEEIGIT